MVQGVYLSGHGDSTPGTWAVVLLVVLSGALLLLGLLTPAAAILLGLGSVAAAHLWFTATAQTLLDNPLSLIFVVTMSVAIVLLGPGAYSLDARLFGRREIIIPQASHSSNS
ncbi:MAG: hypothetical protein QOD00_1085 [Blastocatellia bacterium]|nr:hypothetical protein [Blastocatellia bacterium]